MIFLSSNISLAACESCQAGTFCNSATSYNCVADTTENRTKYNYTPDDKSATSNNTTATTCSAYNSKWTASTEKADC